jgi:predicted transcriptional regulator
MRCAQAKWCDNVFMANTRSSTLSVRLRPEIKRKLAKLAKASGRSANFLISDAVQSYVADHERLMGEVRQAHKQVESGHYVKHEDMKSWLLSWGTKRELPLPPCACGKEHDDEELCR